MHLKWKPPKIFYGWWIVVACFLIFLYIGGAVAFGFTTFFEPIANEFGWSYTQISLAASLRGVELGLLAPFAGLLVDRWGPRRLAFGGTILIGLGLFLVSRTTSLGMFYSGFALVAIGTTGCSATVFYTAITNWFRRKVGIASGILSSGFALGAILIPSIVKLIDVFDWQTAMVILSLGMLIVGLPMSLLVRHKPEPYGYLPDGEQRNTAALYESMLQALTIEGDSGAKQALKSRAFWHIALSGVCQFLMVTAVVAHVMPYLGSVGIARSTSSLVATAIPLISIAGRLGSGWLGDRLDKRWIAAGCFASASIGLLSFSYVSIERMWLLVPFIILFSTGWGGSPIMRVALLREYFGRSKFGTIYGFVAGICAFGSITGPLLAGWVFDTWDSYYTAWLLFACTAFVALIIMATAPPTSTKV